MLCCVQNAPESDLARAADHHLDILAGPERAVAATKTYTAELLTLLRKEQQRLRKEQRNAP